MKRKAATQRRVQAQDWTAIDYCALRHGHRDGWEIVMIPHGMAVTDTDAAVLDLQANPMRHFCRGGGPGKITALTIVPFAEATHLVDGSGWAYDRSSRCWRAPEEPRTPPPVGQLVDRLDIEFAPPDAGWLDVHFRAGSQSFQCALSNAFQDIDDIVRWLEHVADGRNTRFCYNVEGDEVQFDLWPSSRGLHLAIGFKKDDRRMAMNIVIPRLSFVSCFYLAIRDFWESSALLDHWEEWASYTEAEGVEVDDRGYQLKPHAIRSEQLDRIISSSEAGP